MFIRYLRTGYANPNGAFFQIRLRQDSITSTLEHLRPKDEEKYRILTDFYATLKDRTVLREAQDIRHFAQLIGMKEIGGKSRKDMIPQLMRFLLEQPTERLKAETDKAADISEQQRQQGYSVLTDKLLRDKEGKKGEGTEGTSKPANQI